MELTKDTNETGQTEMTQMPDALSAQQPSENVAESSEIVQEQENAMEEKPAEAMHDITLDEASVQKEPEMKELPTTPDDFCGELQEAIEVGAIGMIDKQAILEELKALVEHAEEAPREQLEKLKKAYLQPVKAEVDELKRIFIENGGEEKDFDTPADDTAAIYWQLLDRYKEKRIALQKEQTRIKEENYLKKLQLIDRMGALVDSNDNFNKRYNEFKEIQQQWKEYNPIPQEYARELWRNFQLQSERFYDLVKINNQLRDYDFKKNLEMKTALCEAAEKLTDETDVVSAYHQLQTLFQQWREIGPVSRELREELWARFKRASTSINKRHHNYIGTLREQEEENLKEKTSLCETVEGIVYDDLKSFKDWEKKTQEVLDLQQKWRTIGFASKKKNTKIFERFRKACDEYFQRRSEFLRNTKKEAEANYQLKKVLAEKAEALKESTDWKETTRAMIKLQEEWKKIGPVSRKQSDAIWKRFIKACDYFFEQKNKVVASQKGEETTNLEIKKALIEKIKAVDERLPESEAVATLKSLIAEWNATGHVPFRSKDKIYTAFREAIDQQFDRLNIAQTDRRMQQFRSTLTEMSGQGENKLHDERDKLMRMYERMKNEVQTYENNIGFLNVSSKGGSGLLKEMERKIEHLKDEMALIVKKIDAIDENLE